jgi:hypothetical protein
MALGDTRNRARVDKMLVEISRRRNVVGLIANQVLTSVFVRKDSGLIGKYDKSNLRIEHDIVGGETPYPRVTASVKDTDRYALEKHGLSGVITEEDKTNEEQPFDARKDRTMELTDKLNLGKEIALATPLTSTSVLTNNTTLSGTDQYSDYSGSAPLEDWRAAWASIFEKAGKPSRIPGTFAIVPWDVFNYLSYHPDLLETLKYTRPKDAGLTEQEMARVLAVDRLLIPWSQYNTAKEGQTDSLATVWGKNIIFGYAPRAGTKRMETLGFQVAKRADTRVFTRTLGNPPNADEIMVDIEYDFLLTEVGAAYLIKDAIA